MFYNFFLICLKFIKNNAINLFFLLWLIFGLYNESKKTENELIDEEEDDELFIKSDFKKRFERLNLMNSLNIICCETRADFIDLLYFKNNKIHMRTIEELPCFDVIEKIYISIEHWNAFYMYSYDRFLSLPKDQIRLISFFNKLIAHYQFNKYCFDIFESDAEKQTDILCENSQVVIDFQRARAEYPSIFKELFKQDEDEDEENQPSLQMSDILIAYISNFLNFIKSNNTKSTFSGIKNDFKKRFARLCEEGFRYIIDCEMGRKRFKNLIYFQNNEMHICELKELRDSCIIEWMLVSIESWNAFRMYSLDNISNIPKSQIKQIIFFNKLISRYEFNKKYYYCYISDKESRSSILSQAYLEIDFQQAKIDYPEIFEELNDSE